MAKVKDLLTADNKWVQNAEAIDADDEVCLPTAPKAVAWCLLGAVIKCYEEEQIDEILDRIDNYLLKEEGDTYKPCITSWNDVSQRTFEDIRDLVTTLDI